MRTKIAHPQLKYSLMNGLFWLTVCPVAGFISAFMVPKGYSNSSIGITVAATNILIMLFQPVIASLIDRYRRITLQKVIILFTLISAAFCALLLILPDGSFIMATAVTLAAALNLILQPFVNAVSVELEDRGYQINFGVCRAVGSFGYALISTVMGFLIARFSEQAIPVTSIICSLAFIGATLPLCLPESDEPGKLPDAAATTAVQNGKSEPSDTAATSSAPQSLGSFLMSNKRFLLFLLSVACLFEAHNFTTSYLYQITCEVGGNSADMGLAGSIAAMLELPGMILFSLLLRKASCKTLLRFSGFGFFMRFLSFYLADSVTGLFLAQIPQAFSYALFIPASVHYVSRLFSKADMAKAQSLVTAATTLGGIIASVAGGRLIDLYGISFSMLCTTVVGGIGAVLLFFSVENVTEPAESTVRR